MIGHRVGKVRQQQRDAALSDFVTFCDEQIARIVNTPHNRRFRTTAPVSADSVYGMRGEYGRAQLPPDAFDLAAFQ